MMVRKSSPAHSRSSGRAARGNAKADRIADLLLDMAAEVRDRKNDPHWLGDTRLDPVRMAAIIYADRRRREKLWGEGLFGEPAWDMMLELYVAAGQGNALSTKAVTMGSAVPPTTALRWLETMEKENVIRRFADPGDRRRMCVELSAATHANMTDYLNETIVGLENE